jgi:hypothetical protein
MTPLAEFLGRFLASMTHEVTLIVSLIVGATMRFWWAPLVAGVVVVAVIEFAYASPVRARLGLAGPNPVSMVAQFAAGALIALVVQKVSAAFRRRT